MTTPLRTLKLAYDTRQDEEILKDSEIAELISINSCPIARGPSPRHEAAVLCV